MTFRSLREKRRMVSLDVEDYRQLIRAKGKLEMELGEDLTIGEAVLILAKRILEEK